MNTATNLYMTGMTVITFDKLGSPYMAGNAINHLRISVPTMTIVIQRTEDGPANDIKFATKDGLLKKLESLEFAPGDASAVTSLIEKFLPAKELSIFNSGEWLLNRFIKLYKTTRNYTLISEDKSDDYLFSGLLYGAGPADVHSAWEIFLSQQNKVQDKY